MTARLTEAEIKDRAAQLTDRDISDRIETADGLIREHGVGAFSGALATDYRIALEALAAARRERDEALAAHKRILNEAVEYSHDRAVEVERLTRERDEAEQRGRAAERADVVARVEQKAALNAEAHAKFDAQEDGAWLAHHYYARIGALAELRKEIEAGAHVGAGKGET